MKWSRSLNEIDSTFSYSIVTDDHHYTALFIMYTERHRRLKENVMRTAAKLPQQLAHVKNQRLRILTEQFSDFSLQLLETNIQEALNYKCEVVEEGMCWKVVRQDIQSGSFRLVTRPDNNLNSILHCPCLATIHHGVACRHINCVLLFLGAPVYNTLYFHKHWERRLQHDGKDGYSTKGKKCQ